MKLSLSATAGLSGCMNNSKKPPQQLR
jgi:hypothetical protein